MRLVLKLLAIGSICAAASPALSSTTMSLNTGYDHSIFAAYANPTQPSTSRDNYWIRETAYYNGTAVGQDRSFLIQPGGWAQPLANSRWISGHGSNLSPSGTNIENPSYAIFKKCFCLMPGYKGASLSFQIRADDNVQVWFQNMTNTLLAPLEGAYQPDKLPHKGSTDRNFKVGKNCLYVLVEDTHGGQMGFNLAGSVTAQGLMPQPAAGPAQSFAPCACNPAGPVGKAGLARAAAEERATVAQITRFAETRRLGAVRRLRELGGTPRVMPAQ